MVDLHDTAIRNTGIISEEREGGKTQQTMVNRVRNRDGETSFKGSTSGSRKHLG